VRGLGGIKIVGNSVVYKNLLYACVTSDQDSKKIFLAALDLDSKALSFKSY